MGVVTATLESSYFFGFTLNLQNSIQLLDDLLLIAFSVFLLELIETLLLGPSLLFVLMGCLDFLCWCDFLFSEMLIPDNMVVRSAGLEAISVLTVWCPCLTRQLKFFFLPVEQSYHSFFTLVAAMLLELAGGQATALVCWATPAIDKQLGLLGVTVPHLSWVLPRFDMSQGRAGLLLGVFLLQQSFQAVVG